MGPCSWYERERMKPHRKVTVNNQEWTSMLKNLERGEEVSPEMVWRSADGTNWPAPSSKEEREPILLWPDGREKRVMELGSDELLTLANTYMDSGNRHIQEANDPENPLKGQG
jgi:hypothetical protein